MWLSHVHTHRNWNNKGNVLKYKIRKSWILFIIPNQGSLVLCCWPQKPSCSYLIYLCFLICNFSKIQRRCPQLMQIKDQHFPYSSYQGLVFPLKFSITLRRNIPFLYGHCHFIILLPAIIHCETKHPASSWLLLSPCKNWFKAIRCPSYSKSKQRLVRGPG